MATSAFGLDEVITAILDNGSAFVDSDAGGAGMVIFWLIFLFHVIEGAAEMVEDPKSCRLVKPRFWLRIAMVLALLGGYQTVVVGTVRAVQSRYVMNFADKWAEMWGAEWAAMDTMKNNDADNQDLKHAEVGGTKAGHGDDSIIGKVAGFAADAIVSGFGWMLATLTAVLITVFILLEGFYGLGLNMLLIAIGPICVAFAAHPKTEGIFWSFARAFLVLGLIYMPMLGLAAGGAGVIMAHMTHMTQDLGGVYGDGSDIALHVIFVILGPLCAFALVRCVPAFCSGILQSMHGGGGSTFASGMAAAMMLGRAGGAGGKKPNDDDDKNKGNGGGGGALDSAASRGRLQGALAELARAGAGAGAGAAPASGEEKKADDIRGDV